MIALSITFWIFCSFSSFGTMILLFWFLIFKLLSINKPYDLFIFSFSSDINLFSKNFSFLFFFYFCAIWYPVSFIIQSINYSLIFNRGFIIFVPYIVYIKYSISQKRLEKSGFLLNLISELPNMFLSKISFRTWPKK